MRTPRRLLVLAVASAALLSACGDLFETAAAVVDGRKIDDDEFRRSLSFFLADPRFPGANADERASLARQYLTFLLHQQLIQVFADAEGLAVTAQEVDGLLTTQIEQSGGREAFREQMAKAGVTEDDVREFARQQVLRGKVIDAVVEQQVSDTLLRQEYDSRATEFTDVHASHILVGSREEAEQLAERASTRNFARLAERFSEDPGSAAQGGDLGSRRAVEYDEAFARATLFIPVGQIGGPVETQFGFHLIYVIERTPILFEDAREQLLEELSGEVFSEWLLERIRAADIRVNPRYGFLDESTGEVVERRSTTPEPQVQLTP